MGAPRLDILGAGVATTLVNLGMCAAALWFACARRPFKKYRVLGRFWRADWVLLRQLLLLGLPISGAFLLEFGLFAAAALLMGGISDAALAAHAIAPQVAAILYMGTRVFALLLLLWRFHALTRAEYIPAVPGSA